MKINLKLIIIFLEIALIPTVLLTYITYSNSKASLESSSISNLETTAELQKARTLQIITVNKERLDTITNQPKLKKIINDHNNRLNTKAEIQTTINDIKLSNPNILNIEIVALNGIVLASTDNNSSKSSYAGQENFEKSKTNYVLNDLRKKSDNKFYFRLAAPINLQDRLLGVALIEVDASDLTRAFNDYTTLGKTGEAMLVKSVPESGVQILTPIRSEPKSEQNRIIKNSNSPISHAAKGNNSTFEYIDDYRGKKVLAVTRYLEEVDWGIVVKIDHAEAYKKVNELNSLLVFLGLVSVVVITVIAVATARSISLPVVKLKKYAESMASGNLDQHINIGTTDEFGELGSAFSVLGAKLKQFYATLQTKVNEQTNEIKLVLKQSEAKNAELEKTKKAVLNILEDLEDEKSKLSEITQKDEALVNSIGDSMVVTDEYGEIIRINPGLEKLLGFTEKELLGKGIVSAIPVLTLEGDPVPAEQRAVLEALSTGRVAHATYQLTRKDKTRFVADITSTPYMLDGKPAGAIDIIRDISQQAAIDKAKTEFVSLASHQLRTPLSTINWYLEMVLGGDAGKISNEQKKYLTEIYSANQRMVTLVNSLLNVSRIDLGTFAIEPSPVDLKQTVDNVISELQGQIHKKKMKITTTLDSKLTMYNADPKLAHIIFQNLISNSVKYTPEKGNINVTIQKQTPWLVIEVSDNGYGIPKSQQSKIFSKLFRADNVVTKDTDGTGLGLYLLKAIVVEAGGKIEFKSKENQGTTFTIHLPIKGMKSRSGTRGLSNVKS